MRENSAIHAESFMPTQRPIGFTPTEISGLTNAEVVSQHADESAFLWFLRDRAVLEPHYSLRDLAALDERLEAHLDGLRVADEAGWAAARAVVADPTAGGIFALAILAFGVGNRERMRDVVHAAYAAPTTRRGLISGLGWLEFVHVQEWIAALLHGKSPWHRMVGLAASAIHRADPGDTLRVALDDPDPSLRARALRAVGELKRQDLVGVVREHLNDDQVECRLWASWSLTLHHHPDGRAALKEIIYRNDALSIVALQLGLRAMELSESQELIGELAGRPGFERLTTMGVGVVGDPLAVPWLIRTMKNPELCRLAGEAFSMVTGVDLAYLDLDRQVSESDLENGPDDGAGLSYDSRLPIPDPDRVAEWWETNKGLFPAGQRHLAGEPVTATSMVDVLALGKQRQRMAAALELALLERDREVFEVRGPARRQERTVSLWTSSMKRR